MIIKQTNNMKNHHVKVQEPYYSHIAQGIKTVEGRLNKGTFLKIMSGDTITFNGILKVEVVAKTIHSTFRDMIESNGVSNVIPHAETIDQAVKVYRKFYSESMEKASGVCAIHIKLIK